MKIKILAFIAILFLAGASYAVYAGVSYLNTPKTPEEIELQKTARLLEAQTKIDMDNLKILSDCHEYAETQARYPDELIVIRNACYERGKYPDVLKGEINENGDKIYSGTLTAGSTAVPPSSKIIYEKKDTTLGIEKGVSDDTRTGTEGQPRDTRNKKTEVRVASNNILSILGLDSCRIVQTEDSHIQKGRGSVYAHDIACTRGQSFTVSAPQWKKEYVVSAVGTDQRMGNYIVLKHANFEFVFGHTASSHKVGDRILPGIQIGYTDKSGIAENVHLHFELWRDGYNITADEMLGSGSRWNDEHSYSLRMQRGWSVGIDKAFDFIVGKEGFRSEAYRDVCRKKDENKNCLEWVWSIGFGTASYMGEVISREEATKRAKDYIAGVMEYTYRLRVGYSENQRVAITSFFYNAGKYRPKMIEVLRSRDAEKIKAQFRSRDYLTPGYERGLLKRRNAEIDLFYSK